MFKGRIGVAQYWLATLLMVVLCLLAGALLAGIYFFVILPMFADTPGLGFGTMMLLMVGGSFLFVLPFLIMVPYAIGLQIRRFHDMGVTGWMYLVTVIAGFIFSFLFPAVDPVTQELSMTSLVATVVYTIVLVVIMSLPGTKGPNKYGEQFRYASVWKALRGKAG